MLSKELSEMTRLTMAVAAKALLSIDIVPHATDIERVMLALYDHVDYRFTHVFCFPERVPTPRNRRFWGAVHTLDRIVYRIIDERRRSSKACNDLFAMLLEARDHDTGEPITDKEIRDHIWM